MFSQPLQTISVQIGFTNAAVSTTLVTPNLGATIRVVGMKLTPARNAAAGVVFQVNIQDNTPTVIGVLGCVTGGNDIIMLPFPGTMPAAGPNSPIVASCVASIAGPTNAIVTLYYEIDQ